MSLPVSRNDWIGLELSNGRYRVESKLGEGGMGFVYRVRDSNLDTDVVVKVPRRTMLEDPEFAPRFAREVRSLVRLAHPNIVRISDIGEHDGLPFAVMQYLSGGSLEDRRPMNAAGQTVPCDPQEILTWLIPVAAALDFVHAQGYVHRDVKPGNILFDAQGHVYLSDFGVAKVLATTETNAAANHRSLTGAGMVLGTPDYMAPELIMGLKIDGGIDQYALAVMIYELLCGRTPFEGSTGTAILVRHANEAPPRMSGLKSSGAEAISRIVMKALAKSRADRYPNCTTFATALEAAIRDGRTLESTSDMASTGAPGTDRILCPRCAKSLKLATGALTHPGALQGKKFPCPACQALLQFADGGRTLVVVDERSQPSSTPSTGTRRFVAPEPGPSGSHPVPAGTTAGGSQRRTRVESRIDSPSQESLQPLLSSEKTTGSPPENGQTRRYYWAAGIAASLLVLVGSVLVYKTMGSKVPENEPPRADRDTPVPQLALPSLPPATPRVEPSTVASLENTTPERAKPVGSPPPVSQVVVPLNVAASGTSAPKQATLDPAEPRPTPVESAHPQSRSVSEPKPELALSTRTAPAIEAGEADDPKANPNADEDRTDGAGGINTGQVTLDQVLADPKKFVGKTLSPAGLLSVDNVLQKRSDGSEYVTVLSVKSKTTYPNPKSTTDLILDPGVSQNLRGLIEEGKIGGVTDESLTFDRGKSVAYPVILTIRMERQTGSKGNRYVALITELEYLYWMNNGRIADGKYKNTFRCLNVTSARSGFVFGDGQEWKNRLGMKYLSNIKYSYRLERNKQIDAYGSQIDSQINTAASRMSAQFQNQQSEMMRRIWNGR